MKYQLAGCCIASKRSQIRQDTYMNDIWLHVHTQCIQSIAPRHKNIVQSQSISFFCRLSFAFCLSLVPCSSASAFRTFCSSFRILPRSVNFIHARFFSFRKERKNSSYTLDCDRKKGRQVADCCRIKS